MIREENISYIDGTHTAVKACSIKNCKPHWHENCIEILFVLKGELHVLQCCDEFTLRQGDFVVTNRGDLHYLYGDGNNLAVSLYIDLSAYTKRHPEILYLVFVCESFNLTAGQRAPSLELRKLLVSVIIEAFKSSPSSSVINDTAEGIVDLLVDDFDMIHCYNDQKKDLPEEQVMRYRRIMREIELQYTSRIRLDNLAQKEYMSTTYLSQFWKKLTGMNFTEYLNSRRCEQMEKLMLTTDKSVNEISVLCGFSDTKYAYRSFKKWYDTTPAARKRYYEKVLHIPDHYLEYSAEQFMEQYEENFADALLDEERIHLLLSAKRDMGWKAEYLQQAQKYAGSKIKREMIAKSHREAGINKLFLPLLDSDVISFDGVEGYAKKDPTIDRSFFDQVFSTWKDGLYTICVEISFEKRSLDQWIGALTALADYAQTKNVDLLRRCSFCIFISSIENHMNAWTLKQKIAAMTGSEDIEIALKFD
ncbi:MAG: helix-turn-helix domain-containing protein [Bacillota bacterium]|nr:helix-turn-helix domain-containing protein [Bacillota bacterium]